VRDTGRFNTSSGRVTAPSPAALLESKDQYSAGPEIGTKAGMAAASDRQQGVVRSRVPRRSASRSLWRQNETHNPHQHVSTDWRPEQQGDIWA
jgi:hypothetical protein